MTFKPVVLSAMFSISESMNEHANLKDLTSVTFVTSFTCISAHHTHPNHRTGYGDSLTLGSMDNGITDSIPNIMSSVVLTF